MLIPANDMLLQAVSCCFQREPEFCEVMLLNLCLARAFFVDMKYTTEVSYLNLSSTGCALFHLRVWSQYDVIFKDWDGLQSGSSIQVTGMPILLWEAGTGREPGLRLKALYYRIYVLQAWFMTTSPRVKSCESCEVCVLDHCFCLCIWMADWWDNISGKYILPVQ